ncbi:glycosyltransferase [Winogradskyella sp. 3972H.M.0a.05]|uniref:glycosyltransferase family 4 protein n=1 Tax=Winogradskyella sp. 3972H.M.0a.05 TaxID=2950277 RepID=UPI00339662C2
MKPTVFLESHNLKNRFSGFGQFNYKLIKALQNISEDELNIVLNVKSIDEAKQEFGDSFQYNKYKSITRHKPFRIRKKYDLWHSMNQNIKVEPFYDIPYVLTVHDVHFTTENTSKKQAEEKQRFQKKLNRSDAIVYISEFAKQDTHKHFDVPDVPEYVIYNGNPLDEITITEDFSSKINITKPYLFSIGDFTERKNFLSLVEMLRYLPDYNLVLAGNNTSAYAQKLRDTVVEYQMNDRVMLTGKIDNLEKQYLYKHCDALVFPSLREGFGFPPIEAMTFGKPAFLSNNTSLPEIGGEHSFYWDHYDPEYMANIVKDGMSKVKSNIEFYTDWYIQRAKSYNWENAAREYLNVYKSVLQVKN